MKTFILSLALLLTVSVISAQSNAQSSADGTTITVHIPVPGVGGMIIAGLYDESTFMKGQPLQGHESKVMEGYATITFTNVLPGTYAISLFHDKNDNKKMDFESNGMPNEMYGVSNNTRQMGPPQWSDANFEVRTDPIQMTIRL